MWTLIAASNPRADARSGIAIGPILFVIAILAILATAIAAGSGSFSGNTDTEKARTYASAIIDQMTTMKTAVLRLLALGCKDTEINFANTVFTQVNPGAPPDKHCDVFDIAGGGLVVPPPIADLPGIQSNGVNAGYYKLGIQQIGGFGITNNSSETDSTAVDMLIFYSLRLNASSSSANPRALAICDQVNSMAGISTSYPTTYGGPAPFLGTFSATPYGVIGGTGSSEFRGKSYGCYVSSNGVDPYVIYMVVLAR